MGIHGWDLTIAQADSRNLQIVRKWLQLIVITNMGTRQPAYLVLILPPPTFLFLKITFFIMYRQVFGPMRWMRICAALGAIFTTLFYTIVFVYIIIFTTSHKKETRLYHESTPLQRLNGKFSIPQSGVNLALNLYILVLPIVAVTKLQMAPRRKVGIILIFMTGLLLVKSHAIFKGVPGANRRLPSVALAWGQSLAFITGCSSGAHWTKHGALYQ